MKEYGAITEPMFVQQLELDAGSAGEELLAGSHDCRHDEEFVLVDQPSPDRLGGEIGAANGEVAFRLSFELPDRLRVEVPLDPRRCTGHLLECPGVHDLLRGL